mmetsp:Transcript_107684/g.304613  ORF Transcript_107684/g.304613 Transcript_107684/m.304613 type:complete len:275 (+) Transcript_107684:66-890(+)
MKALQQDRAKAKALRPRWLAPCAPLLRDTAGSSLQDVLHQLARGVCRAFCVWRSLCRTWRLVATTSASLTQSWRCNAAMSASCSDVFCRSSWMRASFSAARRSASLQPDLAVARASSWHARSEVCLQMSFRDSSMDSSIRTKWLLRSTSSLSVAASSCLRHSILVMSVRNLASSGSSRGSGSGWHGTPSFFSLSEPLSCMTLAALATGPATNFAASEWGQGATMDFTTQRSASTQFCTASGFPLRIHSSSARRRTSASSRLSRPAPSASPIRTA